MPNSISADSLATRVGDDLGVSDWVLVDQDRIERQLQRLVERSHVADGPGRFEQRRALAVRADRADQFDFMVQITGRGREDRIGPVDDNGVGWFGEEEGLGTGLTHLAGVGGVVLAYAEDAAYRETLVTA